MRVEDPVNKRGGLILGLALISNKNPDFEMASLYLVMSLTDLSEHAEFKSFWFPAKQTGCFAPGGKFNAKSTAVLF